jgi:hypothetical protein
MRNAVTQANLLSTAIESMASTVVSKVSEVATQFEQLFYQSQRVGVSAQSTRAFVLLSRGHSAPLAREQWIFAPAT